MCPCNANQTLGCKQPVPNCLLSLAGSRAMKAGPRGNVSPPSLPHRDPAWPPVGLTTTKSWGGRGSVPTEKLSPQMRKIITAWEEVPGNLGFQDDIILYIMISSTFVVNWINLPIVLLVIHQFAPVSMITCNLMVQSLRLITCMGHCRCMTVVHCNTILFSFTKENAIDPDVATFWINTL